MNKPLRLEDFHNAETRVISGAGGGSSKAGGSSGSSSAAPDTLFSSSSVSIVGLIGEGEIGGVVGGLKGVYRNDTPIQNADGTLNFKGFTADFRTGTPDQAYLTGADGVANETQVGITVMQSTPVVQTVSDPDLDRVRVTVYVPALFVQKTDGSMKANFVNYRIEIRYYNGPWVSYGDQTITGKTTSGYFRQHSCALPKNPSGASAPWQVRITRLSPDDAPFNDQAKKYTVQSTLTFYSVTSVIDSKFTYPHSAVLSLNVTTSVLGDSVGDFKTLVDGKTMKVPSNRTASGKTRTYSGVWDGTFKEEVADSPIWTLYMLLENDLFGIGEFIDVDSIDKVSFYEIGRYCDQLIPDGAGGMEPRYTFNCEISTQQQAYDLIQLISQIYRGMVYWSTGAITSTQDRPGDVEILVNAENILSEGFSYSSSAKKARHTVAMVRWHDPSNLYKENIEFVESREGIELYGYNPVEIDLLGCTSRGQAHRAGLWTLFTEIYETQVVSYQAGLDHVMVRPGHIISVQDPQISNLDLSGRILAGATTTVLNLDRPIVLKPGVNYTVSVTMANSKIQTRGIQSTSTDSKGRTILTLANGLEGIPDASAIWQISGDIIPQLFRVISVKESQPHIYDVTALQHEPAKYNAIDNGAAFTPSQFSEFPFIVLPPKNLSVREAQYFQNQLPTQTLTLSWTPGQLLNSSSYYVTIVLPTGEIRNYPKSASTSLDIGNAPTGHYKFVVTAVGPTGRVSEPAFLEYDCLGWDGVAAPTVINLQVLGGGTTFGGLAPTLTWANQFANGIDPYAVRNVVYVFDAGTNAMLHREVLASQQTQWTYQYTTNVNEGGPRRRFRVAVSALSVSGLEGGQTAILVENPVPQTVTPILDATAENIFVSITRPADQDFAGFLIWVSQTSGFNPLTTPYVVDTTSTLSIIKGTTGKTYYVRAAAYDSFGRNVGELNISSEYSVSLTGTSFDTTDPGIPQNLALSTASVVEPDGGVSSSVTATWSALTSTNLGKYEVAIAEGASPTTNDFIAGIYTTGTSYTQKGLIPGVVYSIRVRSISANGFGISGWSTIMNITAAANLTPPLNPTNVTVSASFERAVIQFTPSTSRDLRYTEIWAVDGTSASTTPVGVTGSKIIGYAARGASQYWDTLPTSGTRTYWVRAVNTSNVSAASYVQAGPGTSAAITSAQLGVSAVDATKFAAGIQPVGIVDTLPSPTGYAGPTTVLNKADGKLYRYIGGQFVKAVDGGDITPLSITTGSIAAAAIKAAQIDAGAITASKLAITSLNMAYNADGSQGLTGLSYINLPSGVTGTTAQDTAAPNGFKRTAFTGTSAVAANSTIVMDAQKIDAAGLLTYYPVLAGNYYELSASFSGAFASNYVQMVFLNASGTQLTAPTGTVVGSYAIIGGSPDSYNRSTLIAQAPANAVTVALRFNSFTSSSLPSGVKTGPSAIMFGNAKPTQTEVSPYCDWQITAISGGSIVTGTITGTKIVGKTITADQLMASTITSAEIAAGTITAGNIKAGEINADLVTIGSAAGSPTLNSVFGGTATVKISGGAISANSIDANKLRVGSRGVSFIGIEFQWPRDSAGNYTGQLTWTSGGVFYNDNANVPQYMGISAGSSPMGTNLYIVWDVTTPTTLIAITNNDYTGIYNNPNRLVVFCSFSVGQMMAIYGGTIIDGTKITTLSIDTAQLRASAITADKISSAAITAGKIAADAVLAANIKAGEISTNHLAALSISAEKIQAGAITASKLNVGLGTGNLLSNSDFCGYQPGVYPVGFGFGTAGGLGTPSAFYTNTIPAWQPPGMQSLLLTFAGATPNGGIADIAYPRITATGADNKIPIVGGQTYELSSYVSAHRCIAYVYITFYDGNGNSLGSIIGNQVNSIQSNGPLANWARTGLITVAPTSAATASVTLRMQTIGGDTPYTFWTGCYFAQGLAGQSVFSPWTYGSSTSIDGGLIRTSSISADRLTVGSLSAITANIGEVTAGKARSSDSKFIIDFTNKYISISD